MAPPGKNSQEKLVSRKQLFLSDEGNDGWARCWKTPFVASPSRRGRKKARGRRERGWLTRRGQPLFPMKDNPSINPPRKTFDLTPVLASRERAYSQRENSTPAALSRRLPLYY